ncbi:MAG: hypothetical protein HY318_11065 [Armatimonadetes bacterium]|nr:hypothetical protein [Armatimonadota bacterium]
MAASSRTSTKTTKPLQSTTNVPRPVGIVSNLKVVSDKVEDVSSIEAWRRSFIKEGMTDEQKGLAVWTSAVKFRFQDAPPNEYLQWLNNVHDPIKTFNVYGYGMCCCAACNIAALARYAGLQARCWSINLHDVAEVYWDGSWHMLDASLINYFPKPDGKIASVEEIMTAVKEWLAQNPDYRGNNNKLYEFMRADGWQGWRKGPALLAANPFYRDGWWPSGTHGWASTMQEYDGSTCFPFENAYSQGYQVNVQLRPGERLTRNWFNRGLHINMQGGGGAPVCISAKVGQDQFGYTPRYGDLAVGRIGNGTVEYEVPLADGGFRASALAAENLACKVEDKQSPAVHVKVAGKPGVLEIRMNSSYVYLGGDLAFKAVVGKDGGITVLLSDNNGLDWKEVTKVEASGEQKVDLKTLVFRRYDYRVRFVLKGKGTGLDSLKITNDLQHSQRSLPALTQGKNTITFSAGPQEGTVTIEGATDPGSVKGKQLAYTDFHPVLNGIEETLVRVGNTGSGDVTFPVDTPGDMTRLRFGCFYRARDKKDGWDLQVSFDDGKTFKTVDRAAGPFVGIGKYVTFSDLPPGTKKALVRYSGQQVNTTCMMNLRIDADYRQPHGGFRPVKVTYVWEEGGLEKTDVHVARKPEATYTINCDSTPVMKSLTLELTTTGSGK